MAFPVEPTPASRSSNTARVALRIYASGGLSLNAGTKSGVTAFDCGWLFIETTSIRGTDDAVVLKSVEGGGGVDNVDVSGITTFGTAGILGIGDLVKDHVRNVTVRNSTGRRLSQLVSFRDSREEGGGVIENIVCSRLSMTDPKGNRARRVIEIDMKGCTKIRGVRFHDCRFEGRVVDGSQQAGLSLRCSGPGSIVEDVSLHDCRFMDRYHGAPNAAETPGHPLVDGISIERSQGGEVRGIRITDTYVDGVRRSFLSGGCDDGRLHVDRPRAFNTRKDVQSSKVFVFTSDAWLSDPVTDSAPEELCRTNGNLVVVDASGTANPEGKVEASPSSVWRDVNGNGTPKVYVKQLGNGVAGWVAP